MRSLFIILVLMLGLASCNQKSKSPTTEEKPATTSSEFVDVKLATLSTPKDLRCGMPLKEGEIADTANYEGNLYGFCSKECKADSNDILKVASKPKIDSQYMPSSRITGVGKYVPAQVVTNDDLAKVMDTSDAWITERTGIKERRFYKEGEESVSQMATEASKIALERAGKKPEDVDFIIFATLSSDYFFPGSGVLLQRSLPFRNIGALDLRGQCAGFVYGLSVADQFIKTGMYKTVLVVGAEIQSNIFELTDRGRNMSVIFGDGAGAAVLEATNEPGRGILATKLHGDGKYAEDLYSANPGSRKKVRFTSDMLEKGDLLPHMNGKAVFINALRYFPEVIREVLAEVKLKESDINLLVPHQANARITSAIQKELKLSDEQVISNIHKYGNTTAASVPIAMCEAWEEGRIKDGDLVVLAAFGSGFLWGSAAIRW